MHHSFWWDYKYDNFLFYGYNISSIVILVFTCVGLLVFSLLLEMLKMLQAKVRQKRLMMMNAQLRAICPSESDTLLTNSTEAGTSSQEAGTSSHSHSHGTSRAIPIITAKDRVLYVLNDLLLWLSQQITGYLLMLSVMLYNGYMVISVIIGSAIGYFLFGPTLLKINIENCSAKKNMFCMSDCGDPDKTALLRSNSATVTTATETSPVCHASTSTSSTTVISEAVHHS